MHFDFWILCHKIVSNFAGKCLRPTVNSNILQRYMHCYQLSHTHTHTPHIHTQIPIHIIELSNTHQQTFHPYDDYVYVKCASIIQTTCALLSSVHQLSPTPPLPRVCHRIEWKVVYYHTTAALRTTLDKNQTRLRVKHRSVAIFVCAR